MPETNQNNKLISEVIEGFQYFKNYRLEELKCDDKHYIEAFMKYIMLLEDIILIKKSI